MAPSSAVGIEIRKGNTARWRVGAKLGSGACASVHLLQDAEGDETEFAIKLTPLPKKTTKKQNSQDEVNARMLYFEHVMYQNQFQDIQGTYIPELPPYKGPPSYGESDGKRLSWNQE